MFKQRQCAKNDKVWIFTSIGIMIPNIIDCYNKIMVVSNNKNSIKLSETQYLNRTLGSILCIGDRKPANPQYFGSCGPLRESDACNVSHHNPFAKPCLSPITCSLLPQPSHHCLHSVGVIIYYAYASYSLIVPTPTFIIVVIAGVILCRLQLLPYS